MEYTILENTPLTSQVYRMVLSGDTGAVTRPGQFVQIALPGRYLRRPISVCDWEDGRLTLVYKVLGEGTRDMSAYPAGMRLDLLCGLGNGFDVSACGECPLLAGGGVGLPPLLGLAKALLAAGKRPVLAAGFNSREEIFLTDCFEAIGVPVHLSTLDGSAGTRGFVTDAMRGLKYDSVCACGPLPMLRAVYDAAEMPGQFSFEERMGCGFGACMGCSVRVRGGSKRICREGPVLRREEILWSAT